VAQSTCIKCGNRSFEVVPVVPHDSNFKILFVQCSSCGGVVGTQDYYNAEAVGKNLAKALKVKLELQ
jgi:predicted nucleic-acid-binding Zn-ribbon protein